MLPTAAVEPIIPRGKFILISSDKSEVSLLFIPTPALAMQLPGCVSIERFAPLRSHTSAVRIGWVSLSGQKVAPNCRMLYWFSVKTDIIRFFSLNVRSLLVSE
ncbi:hypothetical protein AVEN_212501-1 [Araneus ventricosus]|uniref:Uncharacterized protein n=1 Tax=Araneus ventricosus TaxID=182803 RepID=A0A4Y2SST7_ARAVE|nr:hypothetical protein AVEN_212501-1 [Araneus ventricosus]